MPFLYSLVCCVLFAGLGCGLALSANSKAELSKKEKKQAVQQAVAQYHEGKRNTAKKHLEQVEKVFPENYAIPYYLGLIYLEEGNQAAAIFQWQRYVAMDPKSQNGMKIRKYLTILLREQAGEKARKAVAQKAALKKSVVRCNSMVVTTFENKGYEIFLPLGKGMAALLMADLAQIPELTVVGRMDLQMLLKEMGMGTSELVNAQTAREVGKLLNAKHVATGSLVDLKTKNMQITSVLWATAEKAGQHTRTSKGSLSQFYTLEKEIACRIVNDLGKKCDKMPVAFHTVHTRSLPALVAFSWGLEYGDRQDYDKAREMFQKALEDDPKFALAQNALMATPTSDMLVEPISRMIANASFDGQSSDVVGTSLVVADSGISSTKLIIGGLVVAGGVAALAGGGSDPPTTPKPDTKPDTNPDLSGRWRGRWTPSDGGSFNIIMDLNQTDTSVTGSIEVVGWACMSTGNVTTGTFSEQNFELSGQSASGDNYLLKGSCIDNRCAIVEGTWQAETATGACANGNGSINITKDGNASVIW